MKALVIPAEPQMCYQSSLIVIYVQGQQKEGAETVRESVLEVEIP